VKQKDWLKREARSGAGLIRERGDRTLSTDECADFAFELGFRGGRMEGLFYGAVISMLFWGLVFGLYALWF
jgi:hypothetical protein